MALDNMQEQFVPEIPGYLEAQLSTSQHTTTQHCTAQHTSVIPTFDNNSTILPQRNDAKKWKDGQNL